MSTKNHQRHTKKKLSPKKPEPNKQKAESLIDQFGKTYINTKVNNEKSKHIKSIQTKFDADPSTSRIKSLEINKNNAMSKDQPNP